LQLPQREFFSIEVDNVNPTPIVLMAMERFLGRFGGGMGPAAIFFRLTTSRPPSSFPAMERCVPARRRGDRSRSDIFSADDISTPIVLSGDGTMRAGAAAGV
jgi:hypothetical protein